MAMFILNRPDDYLSLSKKKIFGTAFLWLVILVFFAGLLRMACVSIYMSINIPSVLLIASSMV